MNESESDDYEDYLYDQNEADEIFNEVTTESTQEKLESISQFEYEVLTLEKIVKFMVDSIKEVNQVVQLPATAVRNLLNHFRWDKEKSIDHYYSNIGENNNTCIIKLFPQITTRSENVALSNVYRICDYVYSDDQSKKISSNQEKFCKICYINYPDDQMYALECDHKFCKQCWRDYLTTKILDEGMGQTISCASDNCDILVDDNTVMSLLQDQKVKLKYQQLITNSFVEYNRLIRWCPAPNCSNAVKAQYYDAQPVTCGECTFCFACGELWHDPVKCKWLKKWIKKFNDAITKDSKEYNDLKVLLRKKGIKECPNCNILIEKNGGCNRMTCQNKDCKMQFCWLCLKPWSSHDCYKYYNTRSYELHIDEPVNKFIFDEKFQHYFKHYLKQSQSLELEKKLMEKIHKFIHVFGISMNEAKFLDNAVDVLRQCRQTLMYTYAFAFYIKQNNHSMIFEDNQADLEMATEKLSGYLERDITSDNVIDIKQKVQDKYRYCEQRHKVLLDHVHEGYEKDYWEYQDEL